MFCRTQRARLNRQTDFISPCRRTRFRNHGRIVARQSLQEIADALSDFAGVRFQREVTRVEKAHNSARIVALERLGARRNKERVILASYGQQRRLVRAEVLLKRRIERDVAFVITEQVELDVISARAGKVKVVEVLTIR